MIGVPMPNSRDTIIANLNLQLDQYFGAGREVQEVEAGVSGEKLGGFGISHSNKLRAERDKVAPRLKELRRMARDGIDAADQPGQGNGL